MAKSQTPKRAAVLLKPDICSDILSAHPNDTVQWQNAPAGCKIEPTTSKFPFSPNPINDPATQIATIVVNPAAQTTYYFNVSCCLNEAIHKVIVVP